MLMLILMDVQYSWKAVFSFAKGSNHQNPFSSDSFHPVKNPPVKFLIPPPSPTHTTDTHTHTHTPLTAFWKTLGRKLYLTGHD